MTSTITSGIVDPFASPDAWSGGHYELALELGPRSDSHALAALQRLWAYPPLEGCYLHRDQTTASQTRVAIEAHLDEKLYGVATIEQCKVPCGTFLCRFEKGSDWLTLYLPLGPLEKIYSIDGYPFNAQTGYHDWRQKLDSWLREMAGFVFQEIRFLLGLVGFEVEIAGIPSSVLAAGVPKVRSEGILLARHGTLEWHPPTQ